MWRELVRRQEEASGGGPGDSYTSTSQTPSLTLCLVRSHPSNSNSIANIHHSSARSLLKEWSFQAKKPNICFILNVSAWKLIHADFTGRYRENVATNNCDMIYENSGQKIILSHTKEIKLQGNISSPIPRPKSEIYFLLHRNQSACIAFHINCAHQKIDCLHKEA